MKRRKQTQTTCSGKCNCGGGVARRDFLKVAGATSTALLGSAMPVMAGPFEPSEFERLVPADKKLSPDWVKSLFERGTPMVYKGANLKYIGMPVGGLCAGQLYLGGDGKLWHWNIFNQHAPTGDANYRNPMVPKSPLAQGFALQLTTNGKSEIRPLDATGFAEVSFRGEYPIGTVQYGAPGVPISITLEAFSPFIPLNVDDSSLPATILRFTVKNNSSEAVQANLFGWLENGISINHRALPGKRINKIVREKGYTFLACSAEKTTEQAREKRPDILFEDWNKQTYDGWTAEGTAFGSGPIKKADIPQYQGDVGGDTERVVNSHATAPGNDVGGKDGATGRLLSKPFKIERNFVNFWLGGGNHAGKTCLNVLVDGKVVRSATGPNNNKMMFQGIDVRQFMGKEARIQIVDDVAGAWGNIGVGRITSSDGPAVSGALDTLEDYGTMGLALLGDSAECATATDGEKGPATGAAEDASKPLNESLIGGLGRKLALAGGQSAVVTFVVAWSLPNLKTPGKGRFYATKFPVAQTAVDHIAKNQEQLYAQTKLWRDTWYDSTLPYWFLDRTFANASILATATAFRFESGKFWGWEGVGCCPGTCTHVWHYEQTMGRIFPELDIVLREMTDLNPVESFTPNGMVASRGKGSHPAIDGQAGIVLRCMRDHQVSPDDAFLKRNWERIKKAVEWLIEQDGTGDGILKKNQHNTLDAMWHGAVAWLSGLYLAALRAGEEMANEMGDNDFAARCRTIFEAGRKNFVDKMWNGEYFIQVRDPQAPKAVGSYDGCEIDQVFGQSWAYQVGLGQVLPQTETQQALKSLWKYNFTPDIGPYRVKYKSGRWYAVAGEGGLLMCSWPKGEANRVTTGFDYYFNECMTGFEHQVAGHMVWENMLLEGFAIERAIHDRYHAARRNPWNEVECGNHYARAMASYGVFVAACGFEYHGPKGFIAFAPRLTPENFKAPFTAAQGWGTYSQSAKGAQLSARIDLKLGKLMIKRIALVPPKGAEPRSAKVLVNGCAANSSVELKDGKAVVALAADAVINAGESLEVVLG